MSIAAERAGSGELVLSQSSLTRLREALSAREEKGGPDAALQEEGTPVAAPEAGMEAGPEAGFFVLRGLRPRPPSHRPPKALSTVSSVAAIVRYWRSSRVSPADGDSDTDEEGDEDDKDNGDRVSPLRARRACSRLPATSGSAAPAGLLLTRRRFSAFSSAFGSPVSFTSYRPLSALNRVTTPRWPLRWAALALRSPWTVTSSCG